MKLRGFATLLAIALVSFATPAKADTTDTPIAALQLDNSQKVEMRCPQEPGSLCESGLDIPNLRIAAIAPYSIAPAPTLDHVVMLSEKDGIACLVEAEGSPNGELSCGFVDHE
ncbi:hypothetical protein [Pseudanabaena sp. PCC 6802]|uniref:hypothetical protein n=1 Tax=Pseudanabaena sp. PCC 6802 TaxID=118173 RepID=UPI00034C4C1B|nr:hypothetical protein [Pseudanabaena sp. PCC 6802]